MRVDRAFIGNPQDKIECESVQTAIEKFREILRNVQLERSASGPSKSIKEALDSVLDLSGWEKKFLFSREAHSSLPNANYTVNYLYVEQKCECGFRHKVFLHVCFDNRQAIGTHLLRFKLALDTDAKQKIDKPVAVAIVLDTSSKAAFGWDNSAATFEEFAHALELEYAEIFSLPLHFLILRS
jgi:hypothetical protein